MKKGKIKVVELFAGVGGFRVGLEKSSDLYETVWVNQWEPGVKNQHAFDCYVKHFGNSKSYVNKDISLVKNSIPNHDLLVGGFPCQDYSVARSNAKGIEGKKGVLWWEIRYIIENNNPKYILLENVDRLIKSPKIQRGRDFGIILRCLYDLEYAVEWRVINAAEYGCAQRRRRVFIFAYKNTTKIYKKLEKKYQSKGKEIFPSWIKKDGFYANEFYVHDIDNKKQSLFTSINKKKFKYLKDISNKFEAFFYNSGIMIDGEIYTEQLKAIEEEAIPLKKIIQKNKIDQEYFINKMYETKISYLKGYKRIERKKPDGTKYYYTEGSMCFPDNLDKPARTIITAETGANRSSHIIKDFKTGNLRLLTPIECERLNGFDDDWTNTGMPHKFRYFTMGNALVVPIVTRIANQILKIK